MEDDSSYLASCECAPPTPEHHQLSNVDSSTIRIGDSLEENAIGPRNLWSKRITALWRNRLEDYSLLFALRPKNRKRKTKPKPKCDNDKPFQNLTRTNVNVKVIDRGQL